MVKIMLSQIKETVYKTNTKGNRLAQTDQNKFRDMAMASIIEQLDADITATKIVGGYLLEFPNDELGSVIAEFKLVVKPLDIDIQSYENEYLEKERERLARLEKKG